MPDHDYWPNDDIGGLGTLQDLREADEPPPRLAGLKSVSRAAAAALNRRPKTVTRRPIGFHVPRR